MWRTCTVHKNGEASFFLHYYSGLPVLNQKMRSLLEKDLSERRRSTCAKRHAGSRWAQCRAIAKAGHNQNAAALLNKNSASKYGLRIDDDMKIEISVGVELIHKI